STVRVAPCSATSIAPSTSCGIPYVRTKSQPVPRAMTAISAPSTPASPFATSLTDPSPPTTTRRSAPSSTERRASVPSSPGLVEKSASPSSPRVAAMRAIWGQRFPVDPFAEAGLTRKTVVGLMIGCRGAECDARHAVDRGAQIVVRDPRELAADDDVAHRQQAAGLDAAQRADGEERRRLHLDAEHAALRPALVLALVRVVEQVARDDRPDVELLSDLLRDVHCAVHELPARGRAVRLVVDEV